MTSSPTILSHQLIFVWNITYQILTFSKGFLCTEELMLILISSLNVKKATGAHAISARMLKATAPFIVPSVTKIFNLSLTTGRSLWLGNLPELHPSLKVTSKLFQIDRFQSSQSQVNFWKDMHNLLSHHLHTNCPLSLYHWGFTEGKSTTSTLLSFIHDCHNSSQEVCIVFFDPFDTVSHLPLLYKLSSSKSPIFCWNGFCRTGPRHLSRVASCCVRCPPRIVLGPLLFLMHINWIASSVSHSNITMYADDNGLYQIISNSNDYTHLQEDGACIFRPTSCKHFRVLNINTSHSNFWHEAMKFKHNRPDLHIVTVKNWML